MSHRAWILTLVIVAPMFASIILDWIGWYVDQKRFGKKPRQKDDGL